MLVLKRYPHERIRIGKDIWIEVVTIEGGSVKLGFEAPKDVEIHREEVLERIEDTK